MENITSNTAALNLCEGCFNPINLEDAFCDSCGYPLKGSEMEQKTFILTKNNNEINLAESQKTIKTAGNTLYWIAGGTVLWGIISYFSAADEETKTTVLIVNLILAMLYIGLGVCSKHKPFAAIVSGFSLYTIILILNAIAEPATLARGIVIKIIFIVYFIKGIKSAIEAERIKKELNIE
jgi:hypothetical protein